MPNLKFAVLYGSYRYNRAGIRAVKFITKELEKKGYLFEIIDAKELNLPIFDRRYNEYEAGKAPSSLEKISNILKAVDGFIIVSGEYNNSISPGLKNMMDCFVEEYAFKPSAILCYSSGNFAGVRAAVHLRVILAQLGTSSIPSILAIPVIQKTLSEDGQDLSNNLSKSTDKFLTDLSWHAQALKSARSKGLPF